MTQKVRHIYAAGNTARGLWQFYHSVLKDVDRCYVITGAPGSGRSAFIKSIGEEMLQKGLDVEWIHSPFTNGIMDGVIFHQLQIGIVDGTSPRHISPGAPFVAEKYVDLTAGSSFTSVNKERARLLHQKISEGFHKAYQTFAEALQVHDEWEHVYITNMNVEKANEVTNEMIDRLLADQKREKQSHVRHMFLGAATPQGPVDHIQNLTATIEKRFFIKGRPGSGKSTMLKKIAAEAEKRGFDVEVYHCGFDPNSLDMVILPERSIAIFDSTAPHEYDPERKTDEIVDMYERTIRAGTDEKYDSELHDIKNRYSRKMKAATQFLAETVELREELHSLYQAEIDFSFSEKVKNEILSEIYESIEYHTLF
jgi:energy-coupling factor transporter ATP-binding protein EcfA2